MTNNLYSIKDNLAVEFGPIFAAKNDAVATRQFLNLVNKEGIKLAEFTLYILGSFDSETGTIVSKVEPVALDLNGENV